MWEGRPGPIRGETPLPQGSYRFFLISSRIAAIVAA